MRSPKCNPARNTGRLSTVQGAAGEERENITLDAQVRRFSFCAFINQGTKIYLFEHCEI